MSKADPTNTTPDPDAELIALCAEFDRLERAWSDVHDGGANPIEDDHERWIAIAPLKIRQDQIAPQIWATEAHTLEGIRAKAHSSVLFSPEILAEDSSWDQKFRASILRDLTRSAVA